MSEIILPCFPLKLVAFPGEALNLHIFEPRYKQLITECRDSEKTFIICPHHEGKNLPIGVEMKLLEIAKKHPNGNMDVKTMGTTPVRIDAFYKTIIGKLYPGVEIQRQPWNTDSDYGLSEKIIEALGDLYELMGVQEVKLSTAEKFKTVDVVHKVGFSFEQEIAFLKISDETDRQEFMLDHLKRIVPVVKQMEEMKKRARLNGHFKHVIPPDF